MDRGMSRSVPYLPRYHSLSPARSPLLGRRRFTSLRSVSQPSQRIFYIDSAPTRVVNSYHVHHSPSPQRSYKVTICSSKVNHHLTRSSRSQSAHDLNSSHVYASQEDIFDRSLKEAAARQVGSCDDIYHKAPFFPDVTPSESGVSVGESEEGSIFGGEEDNMSQHSFGSSSAFYEITMDSELDRCDSDNFSGPDSVNLGDRTLDILYEDDLDENRDKRKRGVRRSSRDAPSPDSSCPSPLSYTEARRRELMSSPSSDYDRTYSRFQQLKVLIPGSGSEATAKASKDQSSNGDRRSVSSSPLAQSTPHVSPRGSSEPKLYVTASWDADDPFNEANGRTTVEKSKAARALFGLDIMDGDTTGHSSRIEDSSCNSSCSEDNYSDISNATISSPVPRKTKLVKKSSDKPGKTSTSGPTATDISDGISRSHLANADTSQTKQTGSKLSPLGAEGNEQYEKRDEGNEWWAVYNIGTAKEREAEGQTGNNESGENPPNYQRDIRIVKPLKVNIPLISAGKHGQEKLRKRSQTSPPQSPPKSPSSPKGSTQTWRDDDQERKTTDRRNTNTSHFEEASDHELNELMKFDRAECHKRRENDEEEGKQEGRPLDRVHNLSTTSDSTCENNVHGPGESSLITMAPTSQGEQCFQSLQEIHDNKSKAEEEMMTSRLSNNDSANDKVIQKQGEQFDSGTEIDSSECIPDSFPSPQSAISSVSVNRVGNCSDIDSTHEVSCSTDGQFTSRTSAEYVEGLVSNEVRGPVNIDGAALHSDGQRHKPQHEAVVSDDENDRAQENSRHYELGNPEGRSEEAWKARDKFSSSATLPAETTQVFGVGSKEDTTTDLSVSENKHLNAGTSGSEGETSGNRERARNDVNISAVFNRNTSALEDKTKDESSAQNKSSIEEICDEFQGLYIGLKTENCEFTEKDSGTPSSDNFNSCGSEKQESCLFTKSSPSKDIIDGNDLSNVSEENGQQQERGLSECPQDTLAVDLGIKEENTNMEKFIDPRLASRGGIRNDGECWETPQMVVRVVATAQKIDDTDENSGIGGSERHGSAFYSPRRGVDVTQRNSSALDSPYESYDSHQRVNNTEWDQHYQGQISDNSDANNIRLSSNDRNSNSFRQQEGVGPSLYKDSSKPVVDESIKQPGAFTRGDKGIQDGEKLNAERGGVAFVERGEEFIHVPSSDGKQVRITETSSKHVKHFHRTTIEKIVTTERRVNHSPTGFISLENVNGDSGDFVTDRRTTETIIKEDDDYITTTTTTSTLCPDAGNQGTVSIENSSCSGVTRTTCLPASSQLSVTPTPGRESDGSFYSDPTTYVPSSSPVSTTRLAAPTGASDFNVMRERGDSWDHKNAMSDLDYTSGQVYPSDTNGTVSVEAREGLTSSSNTSGPVMHHESPLDSLQAQLSRISGDLSPFETQKANSENESYVYQDHAEATSVLKQIVRGDTGDFSNFSSRSDNNISTDYYSYAVQGGVENGGKLSDSVTDIDNGDAVRVVKEQYDNDYDYVTTDLPKTTKHVSRPHHHIQLLKPGQLKASSLWTLNEETESVLDPQSPKLSPKRSLATVESEEDYNSHQSSPSPPSPHRMQNSKEQWSADENENLRNSRSMNARFGQRNFVSESSDFDESDGNYSSISTPESSSHRSSSYGREQTPLSETDSVPMAFDADRMDYQEAEDPSQSTDIDRISSFHDFVSGLEGGKLTTNWANNSHVSVTNMETDQGNSQTGFGQHDSSSSSSKTFKTSLAFCVSASEAQDVSNSSSILDNLSASLEQFSSSGFVSALEDKTSFLSAKETHSFGSSESKEDTIDISGSSTLHSWHDDATNSEASSRLHNLDLDLSRISSCASPVPSDFSEGSMYTCTGTAEVKKHVSFDYDIPSSVPVPASTPKANLKSALKRPAAAIEDKQNEKHREKVREFEKLLSDFNISTCPKEAIPEMIFLDDQQPRATGSIPTNYDDLYKSFTNDDSEKKQNHSCIVVEDENMNTFRFKRFLKKSHTKRKKGRKLLRFFSRLSCVSESVPSPESSPKRAKLSDHDAHTYSTDSMPSSKHVISKPVLISSTSFQHHREFLNSSPQRSVKGGGSPSSSNQSLDSFRSRADSAYSSISESAAGALNNSPPSQHTSSSLRVPPASSGSVSSVFHSGSVSGDRSFSDSAYSTISDATNRTFSTFSESDFTLQSSPLPKHSSSSMDTDMMSALSDVFDQLNSCEEEIDTALLNRMRHGHARASTPRK